MGLARTSPFVLIALGLAAGAWLATQFTVPAWLSLIALALAGLALIAARSTRAASDILWVIGIVAVFVFGVLRATATLPHPAPNSIARYNGKAVLMEGVVYEEPDVRPDVTQLRVKPLRVLSAGKVDVDVGDLMLVRVQNPISPTTAPTPYPSPQARGVLAPFPKGGAGGGKCVANETCAASMIWRYGDVVRVEGRLEAPPRMSTFDYREYLARKGVFAWMARPDGIERIGQDAGAPFHTQLLLFKDRVRQTVKQILPLPESALLNGILIGDDNDIPDELKEAFRRTGTSHIVAISGFNVSIVIALVTMLLGRLIGPRRAAAIALPAIAVYVVFVGMGASVVRAALMSSLALVGLLFWRKGFTMNTLCAAAAIMLIVDPNMLYDVGFQLSFMATLGLVLYANRLTGPAEAWVNARVASLRLRKPVMLIVEGVLVTTAAQITTLPLILVTYNQLSNVALLVNAVVLPLQPAVMMLGALAAFIGVFSIPIGAVAAWPAYLVLTGTIRPSQWFSQWDYAAMPVYGFGNAAVAAYYIALLALTAYLSTAPRTQQALRHAAKTRLKTIGVMIVGVVALAAGVVFAYQQPDGKLHVTFAGNSAMIVTPEGRRIVYAGGGNLIPMIEQGMPAWNPSIDVLIVPANNDRAINTVEPIVQRFPVQTIALVKSGVMTETHASIATHAPAAALMQVAGKNKRLPIEPRVELEVDNAGALIAVLSYGQTRIALVGSAFLTPAVNDSDIVFTDMRNAKTLEPLHPRWVVWSDAANTAPAFGAGMHHIHLRNVEQVHFISDGSRFTLAEQR
jgi:competence protein ComEC